MLSLFDPLKSILKKHSVKIDNTVFVLHYRATVIILIAFTIAVSSNQYIGDPIHCIQPTNYIPKDVINSYCWIHATFSLPRAFAGKIDTEVPHLGVDKTNPGDTIVLHSYYQWVAFMLILQASFFYVPRWLWKNWEGGKLLILKSDLSKPVLDEDCKTQQQELLVDYFIENKNNHAVYFIKFFASEILNLINVVSQIFLVDKFLGGEFTTYGVNVINYLNLQTEQRVDPMVRVFPRVTKCRFHSFGPSGDIQRHDTLCILPINIINEKIYVFMWFWFVILAIVSFVVVIYRIVLIVSPNLRYRLINSQSRIISSDKLYRMLNILGVGDWFLLYMLSSNVDPCNFKELIDKIDDSLDENGAYSEEPEEEPEPEKLPLN